MMIIKHFLRLHLYKFTESRQQPSGVGAVIVSLFQKWKGYRIGPEPYSCCVSEPEFKPKQSCLPQRVYSYPHALQTVTMKKDGERDGPEVEASGELLVYHISSLSNELRTLPPESLSETSQDQPWKTAAHSVWPTKRGFYPWEETILRLTCISVPETSPLAFQT